MNEGNHRSQDLQADSVFIEGDELLDTQVLLDPFEEQFNLPTCLVIGGKVVRAADKIVGYDVEDFTGVVFDGDAAHENRKL